MEILGKILGSPARVKIMRLFLNNKSKGFVNKEIAKRSRVEASQVRRELRLLSSVGFIKRRGELRSYDPSFKYASEMEGLLINTDTLSNEGILNTFKRGGKIKLVIVSGIFIKNKDTRVDLLVVGDALKRGRLEDSVRKLEAEIGSELAYAIFDTKEFLYRLNMYDKLVRDIVDFPHQVLFQAKELNLKVARQT